MLNFYAGQIKKSKKVPECNWRQIADKHGWITWRKLDSIPSIWRCDKKIDDEKVAGQSTRQCTTSSVWKDKLQIPMAKIIELCIFDVYFSSIKCFIDITKHRNLKGWIDTHRIKYVTAFKSEWHATQVKKMSWQTCDITEYWPGKAASPLSPGRPESPVLPHSPFGPARPLEKR